MKNLIWISVMIFGLAIACSDEEDEFVPPENENEVQPPAGNGGQPSNEVWMSTSAFLPASRTVAVGTTVRWLNNSSMPHTVTSSTALFNAFLEPNEDFSYTFNSAGVFNYVCTLHPGMTGTITVTAEY
jgi:plastocyanin